MICAAASCRRTPTPDVVAELDRSPLFRVAGHEALENLADIVSCRGYPKGNVLFYDGDPSRTAYMVIDGEVKITLMNEDGREVIIDLVRAGGMVGLAALFDEGPRFATAITLTPTVLARFDGPRLLTWMDQQPAVQCRLRLELARELRLAYGRIAEHALMPVRERLFGALVEIAEREGVAETKARWVAFTRPTHQELAERIGTSREVVTRLLRSLADSGLLTAQGRVIRVPESALIMERRDGRP